MQRVCACAHACARMWACVCVSGSRVTLKKKSDVRGKKNPKVTLLQKYPKIWESGPNPRKIWISY